MYFKFTLFPNFTTALGVTTSQTLEELADELVDGELVVNTTHDGSTEQLKEAKKCNPAFSCATFEDDTRGLENVIEASLLALDFDGTQHKALTPAEFESVHADLAVLGCTHIWYETWSLGLRVVFPLSQPVSADEYKRLFLALCPRFRISPDSTGSTAERLHQAPAVPSQQRADAHRAEFVDTGKLLSMSTVPTVSAVSGVTFAGLKLSNVRVGSSARGASTPEEFRVELQGATDGHKNEILNRNAFSAAKHMAFAGESKDSVLEALTAVADQVFSARQLAGEIQIASMRDALKTVERAISAAFSEVEREQKQALASIPAAVLNSASKAVRDGDIDRLGKLLGPRVRGAVTVELLTQTTVKDIESDDAPYTSVPDALNQIRESIQANVQNAWQEKLRFNQNGKGEQYDASEENLMIVFSENPDCIDLFERDVRSIEQDRLRRDAPWGQRAGETFSEANPQMFAWVRDELKLHRAKFSVLDSVVERFVRQSPEVDPFLEYVKSLRGATGVDTLSTFLIDQFGIEDTEYNRAVTRKTFIAACARADRPGCWLDSILVFYSEKGGLGKTKFWQMLVPDRNWAGTLKDLEEREAPLKLQRYVFAIADEIDRWAGKKAAGDLKAFLTEEQANTRAAYAKKEKVYQRRGVMVGTTNQAKFLHDPSGARRYWVVEPTRESALVSRSRDLEYVQSVRNQVWFEAWQAYQAGESWWFLPEEKQAKTSAFTEILTRREPTAESEAILGFMADASELQASANARRDLRGGKVGVFKDQLLHGHYLSWISELQVKEFFTLSGWHGANVRQTIEAAGFVRRGGRKSTGWELPPDLREEHEAGARKAFADRTATSSAQASALMRRLGN